MKFENEIEIREFVRRFEECAMPLAEFSHAAHVVVGTVFICDGAELALARMRDGLLRFTAHHGKTGVYKEDVTREWIKRLRIHVEANPGKTVLELANGATEEFARKRDSAAAT
jgi:hypothetical protein